MSKIACSVCEKADVSLLICAQCRVVRYCSVDCQKKDWGFHKTVCGKSSFKLKRDLLPLIEKHRAAVMMALIDLKIGIPTALNGAQYAVCIDHDTFRIVPHETKDKKFANDNTKVCVPFAFIDNDKLVSTENDCPIFVHYAFDREDLEPEFLKTARKQTCTPKEWLRMVNSRVPGFIGLVKCMASL